MYIRNSLTLSIFMVVIRYLWVCAMGVARWVAGLGRARRAHASAPPAHAPHGTAAALRTNNIAHIIYSIILHL